MAAIFGGDAVRLHNHRDRVPADVGLDALLERPITGVLALETGRNGVDVRRVGFERQISAGAARVIDETIEQEVRALGAVRLEHGVDRLEPLLRLDGIEVLKLGRFGHGAPLKAAVLSAPAGVAPRACVAAVLGCAAGLRVNSRRSKPGNDPDFTGDGQASGRARNAPPPQLTDVGVAPATGP